MFTARISFSKPSGAESDAFVESVLNLLNCLRNNGQILGSEWPLVDVEGGLDAFVTIPERRSLDAEFRNRYADQLFEAFSDDRLTFQVLGPDPGFDGCCNCDSSSALVLFTSYTSQSPPVRCLDCFKPVPLYLLPHFQDEEHLCFLHWMADYKACDTLQMHCTTGERFGENQLFRHDSSLSRNGRELAHSLERMVEVPVFYYLHKTRGRSLKAELRRRCPSCGSDWRLEQRLHDFDFRCDECRLLSAISGDVW